MKSFLKLIVSIIVVLVIGFTVYFLLQGATKYNEKDASGENLNTELSGNDISGSEDINRVEYSSGENQSTPENEINTQPSETNTLTLSEEQINQAVKNANMIENQNNNEVVINTIEDNIGIEMIGNEYQELLNMLNSNTLTVNVQTAGTMIYILPMSDFVNNQQYHYDENGNLVLYISELMGIGGEVRYYFYDDQLIKTEETVDGELFMNYEDASQILQKSKLVYDKYFKQ